MNKNDNSEKFNEVVENLKEKGLDLSRAREEAARIMGMAKDKIESAVDKVRGEDTGNPYTPLESRSLDQIYNLAKEKEIDGRSKMNKDELIEAIREAS